GLTATWRFGIRGKALTIEASADQPTVARFSLGRVGAAPLRRTIEVPYLHGAVIWLPADKLYVNRCLDWMVTNSSACPQGEATYNALTDGRRNLVSESGYVAVSPLLPEVLPNLPRPASPYLEQLGPKIMWDVWGHFKNSYRGDAEILRELKDNGVDHLAIIQHVWQRYGYDVKLPDHLPPNPDWGGHEGLVEFGRAANECGYVWSLHENYIDLYPDAPSYDPSARVLRADGSPSPAWFNKGTRVQSFGLKANRALGFAERTAPEAHRLYGTNAAYLDVHTCVPPWHQLDHDATQPMAGMCRGKVEWDTALFEYMRRAHQGPLFGEGHWQMYWAGACDGVEAQVDGGEDHRPLLEFDLLKLHPQMVNHGMGYYARWFRQGYNAQWGEDVGNVAHYDQYRAQEIAYGHAGFIGSEQTFNTQWVAKEHHLMYPVQRLYGTARVTDIAYEVSGRLVPSSVAAALGETWRQRITYDSGLTVYVNWAKEPWTISGRVLPRWGVLALGPGTEVSTSLRDGVLADYVDCPDYLFADARTSFTLPHASRLQVEPKLTGFRYLGDDKIELTYTWQVDQELDRDYAAFVHFVSPNPPADDEGIVFQGDHALPRPTRTWRPGERLTDGPWVV
ncbi:MAG: hypothetical protein HUU35_19010, partial [Armatimonadetes bacterium]|nr:hypothetical protein [Armatimonadota bacterium]